MTSARLWKAVESARQTVYGGRAMPWAELKRVDFGVAKVYTLAALMLTMAEKRKP